MTGCRNHLFGRIAKTLLSIALLWSVMPGHAFAQKRNSKDARAPKPVDPATLVWPAPPDVSRIRWQVAVSAENDVDLTKKKKKASWMDKIAGVSLPEEHDTTKLMKPYGVAVDSKGVIYVADISQSKVFVFDLENKKTGSRGASGDLKTPAGVAVDDTDRLFVSDPAQRLIFVYRPDGSLESAFGDKVLRRPNGLAIDNENRFLYVADTQMHRITVFDADTLKLIRHIGGPDPGNSPGKFNTPTNVALDSENNLYVTDTFNDRVQAFNADGEFLLGWGKVGSTPGTFMRPKGIAVDSDDHIYVVDAEFNNVQVFDRDGSVLMVFGDRGNDIGGFVLANGIGIDKERRRVIVTEQWRGRMQVFRYITDAEAKPEYLKLAKAEAEKAKAEAEKPKAEEGAARKSSAQ